MIGLEGWAKIKPVARYAGVSERTLRGWLKQGLKHVKLPTGMILVRYGHIDEFLQEHLVDENKVDKMVETIFRDLQ